MTVVVMVMMMMMSMLLEEGRGAGNETTNETKWLVKAQARPTTLFAPNKPYQHHNHQITLSRYPAQSNTYKSSLYF